jgi:hypothetical protein
MENRPSFSEIRRNVEIAQRATTFPDTLRAGTSVDAFLWHGDPRATPVQRAGLVIFALIFLSSSIGFVALMIWKLTGSERLAPLLPLALSSIAAARLIRNVFLRAPQRNQDSLGEHDIV